MGGGSGINVIFMQEKIQGKHRELYLGRSVATLCCVQEMLLSKAQNMVLVSQILLRASPGDKNVKSPPIGNFQKNLV